MRWVMRWVVVIVWVIIAIVVVMVVMMIIWVIPTIIIVSGVVPRIIPTIVWACPTPIPLPCPIAVRVGRPSVAPIPRIGPCRGYPCVCTLDINIPIATVEHIYRTICRVADAHCVAGIVETMYLYGVLIVAHRAVKAIEIIAVFHLYIECIARGNFIARIYKCIVYYSAIFGYWGFV